MKSTLPVLWRFPPPSACTDILARLNSPCTRLATDARKTFVLQLVIRHMVLLYILFNVIFRPVDEWVYFDEVVNVIPFYYLHVLSGHALLLSQSTDPNIQSFHCPFERFQFSHLATAVATFYGVIKQIDTFFFHHLLYCLIVGEEYLQVDAIRHVGLVDELVSLREKATSIKCEDACSFICLHDDVGKRLIFYAERRRKSDAPFECLTEGKPARMSSRG